MWRKFWDLIKQWLISHFLACKTKWWYGKCWTWTKSIRMDVRYIGVQSFDRRLLKSENLISRDSREGVFMNIPWWVTDWNGSSRELREAAGCRTKTSAKKLLIEKFRTKKESPLSGRWILMHPSLPYNREACIGREGSPLALPQFPVKKNGSWSVMRRTSEAATENRRGRLQCRVPERAQDSARGCVALHQQAEAEEEANNKSESDGARLCSENKAASYISKYSLQLGYEKNITSVLWIKMQSWC